MPNHCPLCESQNAIDYGSDKKRHYFCCQNCALVFADPNAWPNQASEKAEYDLHQNDVADEGYNRFLQRIVEPLNLRIPAHSSILDFGCGPAPALALQLEKLNHTVSLYDVFYAPNSDALEKKYHAIVLTEVIEHLHRPMKELNLLWQQINSDGVLAIMTQRVINQQRFQQWAYKNDPTHVCFYSEESFHWLANKLQAKKVEFVGRDMVFITK